MFSANIANIQIEFPRRLNIKTMQCRTLFCSKNWRRLKAILLYIKKSRGNFEVQVVHLNVHVDRMKYVSCFLENYPYNNDVSVDGEPLTLILLFGFVQNIWHS